MSRRVRLLTATAAGLLAAGSLVAVTQLPASAASAVTINGGTTFQTIDGFGISEAFSQANNIRTAPAATQRQALDLLFNTSTGAGFSILRSLIPSDSGSIEPSSPGSPGATPNYVWANTDTQDQGQLWLAKQAKNTYGVTQFYNDAWSAPGFMKTNNNEANGGSLCGTPGATCASGDWRQAYANYLVQHAKFWNSAGVTPTYLGFTNEPSLTATYSSMLVNTSQAASFLSVLAPTLAASGLPTKATCFDTLGFNLLPGYVSAVGSNAGLFTSHGYSGAPTSPVSAGSRHVWETEWSVNGATFTTTWDSTAEASGITWAQRIHTALTGANLNAFLYFWGVSNTSHDSSLIGLNAGTLTPTKRYYALANYARYIRPGATRISASSGDANLKTSAFTNTDGSVVVVVLNTGSAAISTNYTVANAGVSTGTVASYLTNESSSMAAQSSVALAGGAFTATVPARSLVTYRITGGTGPGPSSSAPSSAAPSSSSAPAPSSSTPTGGCAAAFTITNSWNGGFQANVTVTNNGSGPLNGWTVRWTLAGGQTITQLWSGTLSVGPSGAVTVTPASYNATLAAGASTTFGFLANGPATPPATITCASP